MSHSTKTSCIDCKKRPLCKELCKAIERLVSVDYIPQRELIPEKKPIEIQMSYQKSTKSTVENIISLFFIDHMKQSEIAGMLCVSKQYVSRVIRQNKAILIKNLKKSG